jgi:hypothetical protein
MSYSHKLAQKLLDDLVTANTEIVSIVLIDLRHGAVAASYVDGIIPLTSPELIAQFIQLYVSHQTLDLLIDNGNATSQIMVRRDFLPKESTPHPQNSSDYLVWRWDRGGRWLLVSHTRPMARLGSIVLDMSRMLDECARQLID